MAQAATETVPPAYREWPCETCAETTVHAVLRQRGGWAVLRCETCATTVKAELPQDKPLQVRLVISEMNHSRSETLEVYPEETLAVGDQFFHGDHNLLVTALEVEGDRRVGSAPVTRLKTVWAKVYDRVRVGVAVNRGAVTTSGHFWCPPSEEISIGDEVELGNERLVVVAIKTPTARLKRGYVQASSIRRLYCQPLKGQRGQREGRQRYDRRRPRQRRPRSPSRGRNGPYTGRRAGQKG